MYFNLSCDNSLIPIFVCLLLLMADFTGFVVVVYLFVFEISFSYFFLSENKEEHYGQTFIHPKYI